MDLLFYFFVGVSCTILLLAMWAFAARDVNKWGPDLTLELPAEVIHESLVKHWYGNKKEFEVPCPQVDLVVPSAPVEDDTCPLLAKAKPAKPPLKPKRMAPPPPSNKTKPKVPPKPVFANTVVRVLPEDIIRHNRLKTTTYVFEEEKPA